MDDDIKNKNEPFESEEENQEAHEALPMPSEQDKLADELLESKDRFLRLAAEFENFKKITIRERANSLKFANENLVMSILPVMDNLEQAVIAGKNSEIGAARDLLVGVDMVLKQLIESLQKFGVEFFSALGLPFDPSRHEAVCEIEDDQVAVGTVVQEYQKGCLLNGRLIRPARVAVAKKSSK